MARDRVRMVRGLSDRIQESVGGLQEIYANDTVAYESGRFRHLLQRIFKIRLRIYNLKYLIKWINNFLEKFGQFLLLLVGGWLIINHPETFNLGILVAFLQAYSQLNEPWRELINFFQLKENARVKYEQVIANFDPPGLRTEFARDDAVPRSPAAAGRRLRAPPGQCRAGRADAGAGPPAAHPVAPPARGPGRHGGQRQEHAGPRPGQADGLHGDGPAGRDGPGPGARPGWPGARSASSPRDARLFTGSVLDNLLYGLRHRRGRGDPSARRARAGRRGLARPVAPRGRRTGRGSSAVVLEAVRLVGLEDDLFAFGLRSRVDPDAAPGRGRADPRPRGAWWRSASPARAGDGGRVLRPGPLLLLRVDRREHPLRPQPPRRPGPRPARRAPALPRGDRRGGAGRSRWSSSAPTWRGTWSRSSRTSRRDNELFARFSLVTASELPEYAQLVARLGRGALTDARRRRTATG